MPGDDGCQFSAAARLLVSQFGDEAVAFDRSEGRTHFLSPIALAVYQELSAAPLPFAQLLDRVQQRLEVEIDPADRNHIRRMLDQLVALNLVSCRAV